MRQHVNPLSRFFQLPLKLPSHLELFASEELPIHLDIGSAKGQFLIDMAGLYKDWNFLGVEIRKSLVISAERQRSKLELNNLRFEFCNANVSLGEWLLCLPQGRLKMVTIQFPDPWFKRRHFKRRVLQPNLLLAIASVLEPGRKLFLQTDLLPLMNSMINLIELSNCFDRFDCDDYFLEESPFPIATERELYAQENGLKVFRLLYIRNNNSLPNLESIELKYQATLI